MEGTLSAGLSPRVRRAVIGGWATVLTAFAVYAVHIAAGVGTGPRASSLLEGWLYNSILIMVSLLILARAALVREERLAWLLVGAAVLAWSCGDVIWWRVLSRLDVVPYPSVADGFYLLFFPFLYAALVVLLRARVRRFHASQWLDGIAAALVVAALGSAVLLDPILAATGGGSTIAVATNLAYPLGDLLILGLLVALAGLMGWCPGRAVGLLAAGCLTFTLADTAYLFAVAGGTYVEGGALDLCWPVGVIFMGVAAWQPVRRPRTGRLEGWTVMVLPSAVVVCGIALLIGDHYQRGSTFAVWLAGGALVVSMLRAGLTFRENIAQAATDSLTGLPNRLLFTDRAEQAVLRARRGGGRVAVMIIDLDRFKEVNDTLGHASGDRMLQEIASRLRGELRESDTVARLGGDEFAVLLPGVRDAAAAEEVARALSAAIALPVPVGDLVLDTEASVGIAMFPDHGDDVAELLKRADVAMYSAKAESRPFAHYGPEQDRYSTERLTVVTELRRAIEEGDLVMHYQPQVCLRGGALAGVEALMRWQHPVRGLLPPGEFIPLAEHTALIGPLTLHAIDLALGQAARWSGAGRDLRVAVNISARNLLDAGFAGAVRAVLARHGVPAWRLELEITETALMADPRRALEVLTELGAMGVALSIDDFGVGYTSLTYLKSLPVGALKIDRSFVQGMLGDPADAMIVRSIVDLARNLGLGVVAEGIESQEVLDALAGLGCEMGQGFHIGRPMSPGRFERWLAAVPSPAAG